MGLLDQMRERRARREYERAMDSDPRFATREAAVVHDREFDRSLFIHGAIDDGDARFSGYVPTDEDRELRAARPFNGPVEKAEAVGRGTWAVLDPAIDARVDRTLAQWQEPSRSIGDDVGIPGVGE